MPFRQHRGGGTSGRRIHDMSEVWDDEWNRRARRTEECGRSPSWQQIRRYLRPPGRVLEAGCGLGHWVKFLHDEGFEAYGIDFAPVGIEKARQLWPDLEGRLSVGDFRHMPYEDNFFDAIVSFGAIEHNEEGIEGAVRDMIRVLKPGGLLYCTVPCMNRLRYLGLMALQDWVVCNPAIRRLAGRTPEVAFYQYVFYRREYEEILRRAGFEWVELYPQEPMVFCGGDQAIHRRILGQIHRLSPWTMTHMMAAACRKPNR